MKLMNDYQKIQTLFKRDANNIIIPTQYTLEEFKYLENCLWECTEKIDGTNIHIDINQNADINYCGRTSNAQIPAHLMSKLRELFPASAVLPVFDKQITEAQEKGVKLNISVYGEGYGAKIQKGGNYIKNDTGFILFDVRINNWWLNRAACEEIAKALSIPIVPLISYMTIPQAIEYVKKGFKSTIAENKDYDAEGLVLKTPNGILLRNGERIITKIKTCDFQKFVAKYGENYTGEQPVNPHY
jgi:hypothetical protein